jgi:3D (Asp-Asp-Asp) domain-containing protein
MSRKNSFRKKSISIILGYFFISLLITTTFQVHAEDTFSYSKAPIAELGEPFLLWATNYHLPEIINGYGKVPLRDTDGEELGPNITLEQWCRSALEGSVRILYEDGRTKTFNYDGSNELFENDCSAFYPFKLGKSKFKLAKNAYGHGAGLYNLKPFRTVATDPNVIPTGTILYIPAARGAKILLDDGKYIIHDGYFFAGDVGGAVKLDHIDVFIGTQLNSSFFPWISSASNKRMFKAYIVKDQSIIDQITEISLSN